MKGRWIKRTLIGIVALLLIATAVVFIGYRQAMQNPQIVLSQIEKEADMHLKKVRQTATKNGIREWHMEAESATLVNANHTMVLVNPDVEVFMTDGDNVHLTAKEGIIHTESNRLEVSGDVVATTRLYRFQTQSVVYDPEKRELRADTPVLISSASAELKAGTMQIDLKTNITRFEGDVKGTISEDLQL